jgi:hypothetical protein
MDNRIFGYCVFGGALIGALFGLIWSGAVGLGFGALTGAGIGWFVAAAVMEQRKQNKEKK